MITVKANQNIFTYAEIMRLTGICSEHLHNLAKRHPLGFLVRALRVLQTKPIDGSSTVGT